MPESRLEFQDIYETFRFKIHRYLTRLVGEHEAEDLTQEVFVKVAQTLEGFRGDSQLSTWIYRIATNAALDKLRSPVFQRVSVKLSDSNSDADVDTGAKDVWAGWPIPSIEQQFIQKEMTQCIRDVVERLPENDRRIVVLGELAGLKNSEIAGILGVSLGTVKIRLHRARQRLRKELAVHCQLYRDERNELACDMKSPSEESPKPS